MLALPGFFLFKQKTAYEMRISDWSSDVCSSDLIPRRKRQTSPRQRPRWGFHRRSRRRHSDAQEALRPTPTLHRRLLGKKYLMNDRKLLGIGIVGKIGRAHVWTPVTNAHLVCRLLLEKKKPNTTTHNNDIRYYTIETHTRHIIYY